MKTPSARWAIVLALPLFLFALLPAEEKTAAPVRFSEHLIADGYGYAFGVAAADLDGDGDLDLAASAWNGNHFAWFENPGKAGLGKEWKKHIIDEKIAETRTIRVADFNGDGKLDLLGTARGDNLVVWYENSREPAGKPWKRH